jgi:hypothetical protein
MDDWKFARKVFADEVGKETMDFLIEFRKGTTLKLSTKELQVCGRALPVAKRFALVVADEGCEAYARETERTRGEDRARVFASRGEAEDWLAKAVETERAA